MARKTETRSFGEGEDQLTFTVTQVPGTRGTRLSHKVSRTILPALLKMAKGLEGIDTSKGLGNASFDLSKLLEHAGDGLSMLFDSLPVEEFEKLWKELFEFVQVTTPNGRTAPLLPVFDELFAGRQLTFFQLLAFTMEVNFKDFFQASPPRGKLKRRGSFFRKPRSRRPRPRMASLAPDLGRQGRYPRGDRDPLVGDRCLHRQ